MAAAETVWGPHRGRRDWGSHVLSPGRNTCRWRRVGSPTIAHEASQIEGLGLKMIGTFGHEPIWLGYMGHPACFQKRTTKIIIWFHRGTGGRKPMVGVMHWTLSSSLSLLSTAFFLFEGMAQTEIYLSLSNYLQAVSVPHSNFLWARCARYTVEKNTWM